MSSSNRKVAYFFNQEVGKYYYGKDHPMKPKRVAMTHSLITNLGLYKELDVYQARYATEQEIVQFHDESYIKYLKNHISSNAKRLLEEIGFEQQPKIIEEDRQYNIHNPKSKQLYKVGESSDCPSFDGLYNFCQISAGGSIDSAQLIISQQTDIAINWAGGLHHAKKKEASGFCYVNDIVLSILELLKFYPRVIYIDIDVHHGDGVEEAFFLTNRVMTVSFHQYGEEFFPGSGSIDSIGDSVGKYHALNIPMKPGITDDQYQQLFLDIMKNVMQVYRPNVIVLQCGADSIAYDKLGNFNLSTRGHGFCVQHMMTYGLPMIVLGGGGYTVSNVARCWAYETGILLGKNLEISTMIPLTEPFYDYYGPDHKLHVNPKSNLENKNTPEELNKIQTKILEYLKELESAPSMQFHYTPDLVQFYKEINDEDYEDYELNLGPILVERKDSE